MRELPTRLCGALPRGTERRQGSAKLSILARLPRFDSMKLTVRQGTPIMLKRRRKSVGLAAIIFAVIVGFASSVAGPIHAQVGDNDYVDVAVTLEVPDQSSSVAKQRLDIIVVNNGLRTAYDVEVVVDVVYPDRSYYFIDRIDQDAPTVPAGSIGSAGERQENPPVVHTRPGGAAA